MRALPHLLVNLSEPGLPAHVLNSTLSSIGDGQACFGAVRVVIPAEAAFESSALLDPAWEIESERDVIQAANSALTAAGRSRAQLMVLDGANAPNEASLSAMQKLLERDPYFAFVEPRISTFGPHLIAKLDADLGDPELASLPRTVIDSAAEHLLVPDHLGRAVLIRENVVRDFAPLDDSFETLAGALRELIARARRVGFRCVIANRALVASTGQASPQREARGRDFQRAMNNFPELPEIEELWKSHPIHEYESKLGRAASFSAELRQTLLIDLTDMGAIQNGTTESVLGMLRGIRDAGHAWRVSLLVSPETTAYHRLRERFPEFAIDWPAPSHRFTAVFRPVQPWSIASQVQMHQLGLFNFCFMHDTISDDIFMGSPRHLAESWAFLAQHADGILYNSEFTRQRFGLRFPVASSVDEFVCLHSLDPSEYGKPEFRGDPGTHIYVVGNDYPHKWMQPTITHLAAAFPYQTLKALGYENPSIPNLEGRPSGYVSEAEVEALYGEARIIVYPSQYEGFGLPIVRGLSYGKDVIARKSGLTDEIADHYRGPGRLIEFETLEELIEAVGKVLHGLPLASLPLGGRLGPDATPRSWKDVGAGIIGMIENRTGKLDSTKWKGRQEAISNMEAFAGIQEQWRA